jgi:Ras GTPase-activating protein 1
MKSFESKVVEHAEKIYATLRECREQCGLQLKKAIKMQGWLNKRSEKAKKWKCLYFVLQKVEGGEMRLYYYESPKRMKPNGLLDLSFSYLYQVHESYLDRTNCFQIVERDLPCMSTVMYLNAASMDDVQDWMCALRPHCVSQNVRAPKIEHLKVLRCIQIAVLEARHLPVKIVPNPFCIVSIDQVKCCRTQIKIGSDPVWEDEFLLDDIPPDILTVNVTLMNKGKRSRDSEVAEVTLELANLTSGEEDEQWHPLLGVTPVGGEWGSLRLRVRYLHDLIMPKEEYSALLELLLDPDLIAVQALADVCHSDRMPLAAALLRVFLHERQEVHLLQVLCEAEIQREEETSTLFRSATLTTSLMDLFMRIVSHPFLEAALASMLRKIVESKQSCELNPMKMDNPSEACANAEFLLQTLDELTDNIFMSVDACPMTIRYVFGCLQRSVSAKWPQERLVRTRVISGFIFLRLLCPAILNPRQFNLLPEPPPPQAARSLIMIAKCLQNLANLVEFGGKESYMEVVNPVVLKNKEKMIVFLDQLSNVKEKPPSEDIPVKNDPARDLATLHHICDSHLRDFVAMSRTETGLRRLVTVTEMLTKHKKRYMELIR